MPDIQNLVFEGGGVKGIAYVGALEALTEAKVDLTKIKRIGGASAGAITGLLLGLNYSQAEIETMLKNIDFNSFKDDDWGAARDFVRAVTKFGFYKGDFFLEWAKDRIRDKTGNPLATFKDVQQLKNVNEFKDMYFIATNLTRGCTETFSFEHTPEMPIAFAVRASMSIPMFFAAFKYNNELYVDGGLLNNYPVRLFDKVKYLDKNENGIATPYYDKENKQYGISDGEAHIFNAETLGFRLEDSDKIHVLRDKVRPAKREINNIVDYTTSIIEVVVNSQQDQSHIDGPDWERTIYIDSVGVKTTDFDLNDEQKKKLINSGREGVKYFFAELSKRNMKDDVKEAISKKTTMPSADALIKNSVFSTKTLQIKEAPIANAQPYQPYSCQIL